MQIRTIPRDVNDRALDALGALTLEEVIERITSGKGVDWITLTDGVRTFDVAVPAARRAAR
jgi:hypothetical protein